MFADELNQLFVSDERTPATGANKDIRTKHMVVRYGWSSVVGNRSVAMSSLPESS
jgi:hypothetical protein